MQVRDWMTGDVEVARPDDDVASVRERLDSRHVRQLPVMAAGTLVGIITDRDVRSEHDPTAKVATAMRPYPTTTTPATPIEDAAAVLRASRVGALPVVEDGALVGIVSESDLLQALIELTRVLEPTTLIDVECPDGLRDAQRAHGVLERHGAKVLWMRSTSDPARGARATFRVRAPIGTVPEQALEEAGFGVSACITGSPTLARGAVDR